MVVTAWLMDSVSQIICNLAQYRDRTSADDNGCIFHGFLEAFNAEK